MDVADDLSASVSKIVVRPNQQQLLLDAERERRLGAMLPPLPKAMTATATTSPMITATRTASAYLVPRLMPRERGRRRGPGGSSGWPAGWVGPPSIGIRV